MKAALSILTLILLCLSIQADAQDTQAEKIIDNSLETKLANFKIDQHYRAGEYLIFDCKKKAYTCVDENSYETCKTKREESKAKGIRPYFCAPLKKFADREKCLIENYKAVEAVNFERFCYPK